MFPRKHFEHGTDRSVTGFTPALVSRKFGRFCLKQIVFQNLFLLNACCWDKFLDESELLRHAIWIKAPYRTQCKTFWTKKEEQCSYTLSLDVPPRWDFLECGAQFLGEALLVCSSILLNFLWTASALFPVYYGKHGPWVCLPPEWRFNGKMMINHWISGYTILRQTHMMLSSTDPAVCEIYLNEK